MKNKAIIYILFWNCSCIVYGQSFFNIIPEIESIEGQGSCRVLMLGDTSFLVFGHRFDTSYGGSNAKPWFALVTYKGQIQYQYGLKDESYENSFNPSFISLDWSKRELGYGYSGRFLDDKLVPYIFKFKLQTGEIIKSKLIENSAFPGQSLSPAQMIFIKDTFSLLGYNTEMDSTRLFITEADTSFNIFRELRIKAASRKQFPKYFKKEEDGTYTLILDSFRPNEDDWNDYNTSYMRIASNGDLISFKWAPTNLPMSNLLLQAKNVIRNQKGEWVILSHHLDYFPDSCLNCAIQMPYIFSITADFDSLLWETRFFDIPYLIGPYYHVYALTEVADGYIGAGELLRNLNDHPVSGTLIKAGVDGDSLWMKHYIPLEWGENRARVARFYDIKTTPEGTIIATGEVYDDSLKRLFPWILHLDRDGCLVPGCNTISSVDVTVDSKDSIEKFKVYPNPVGEMLYILSKTSSTKPFLLSLVRTDGTVLRSTKLEANEGNQYTLPLMNLPTGSYYILISDPVSGFAETHNIIKL